MFLSLRLLTLFGTNKLQISVLSLLLNCIICFINSFYSSEFKRHLKWLRIACIGIQSNAQINLQRIISASTFPWVLFCTKSREKKSDEIQNLISTQKCCEQFLQTGWNKFVFRLKRFFKCCRCCERQLHSTALTDCQHFFFSTLEFHFRYSHISTTKEDKKKTF
jgi:hypothetical protein